MSANFLLYPDAFILEDNSKFCEKLSDLNNTVIKAKQENNDNFYRANEIEYTHIQDEKQLYEFTYFTDDNDRVNKQRIIPGFTEDYKNLLIYFLMYPVTDLGSDNLEDLYVEFPEQCNGLAGLDFENIAIDEKKCVWNIHSWYNFHFNCYSINPEENSFIENQRALQGNTFNEIFPNLQYSNELSNDANWSLFYKHDRTEDEKELYRELFGSDDIIPLTAKLAEKVANRNFYKYNPELSRHNDNNNTNNKSTPYQIFESSYENQKVYLSTDFEKGTFEVCNHRGIHQGEFFFNGNYNTNSKDDSGGHDILIPN